MKKHLALVLALVMVLTSFSFVSAAPDFADVAGTEFENAVNRLELLEILKGYPDGTFKPEDSITRAEFAAVAVRAKGLSGVAEAAAGLPSGFSDVPAWHWAAGYVGTAGSTGIVNGIGNGLFAPAAPVKYEEAVTMLVRALGYEPEAQTKGGYPYGYLVVAEEIGLLDGARSTTGSFATRGLVALLTDNAMEIPMMVSIGFGDNVRWVVSGSKEHGGDEVYLLHSLGVDEFEGIVMENFHVNSRLDADEIKMYDLSDEKMVTLEVTGSVDVNAILGLEVTAWAKDDVVFAVTVDTDADLVAYDSIVEAKTTEDVVYLYDLDEDYDWAVRDENYGDAKVYVNNAKVDDVEDAAGFGRIVMNDDDEVVFAYLFTFDNFGVVTEIDENDMNFISIQDRDEDVLELDEAEAVYVLTNEYAGSSLEEIEEGTSVFFWIDSDDNYFIVATESKVEGELEEVRVRDSRVKIDGTNYPWAEIRTYSLDEMDSFKEWNSTNAASDKEVEGLVDEAVVVYLDLNGEVMLLATDASVTTTVYGVATWFSTGRTDRVTVFNGEGEEVEYAFDKVNHGFKDATSYDETDTHFRSPDSEDVIAVGLVLDKDAEAKSFTTDGSIAATEGYASKPADNERVRIAPSQGGDEVSYYLSKDTVIIKALNSSGELKPSVIKYDDLVDLLITTNGAVKFISEDGRNLDLIVFTDKDFEAKDDTLYAVATDNEYRRGSDYYVELDVAGEGKDVYQLADRYDIRKGDFVTFYLNNSGEAVKSNNNTVTNTVDDKLTNFLVIDSIDYRVSSDTVYYKLDSLGRLDRATSFASIKEGMEVTVLYKVVDGEREAMVVLDRSAVTDGSGGSDEITVTTSGAGIIVVENLPYDDSANSTRNDYIVRMTSDATNVAVYSSAEQTITAKDMDLVFAVKVDNAGFYNVEVVRIDGERVVQTERLYLRAN